MAQKEKKNPNKDKESSSGEISRRFKQNPALFIGTVVVLVLVIVSFVLVPALTPQAAGAGGEYTFGYYDKVPIAWVPGNVFSRYRDQAVWNLQAQGRDVNDFYAYYEVLRSAFESTVVHTAVLQMMKKSNYAVPEKTVDREVAKLPQFQENGRFSRALYNQMSDSTRLTLWRQVSEDLSNQLFFNDYQNLLVPSTEVDFIVNMASVLREFELVYFKIDDFPESEYLAFARNRSSLFDTIHLSMISVNSNEREARRILDSIKDGTVTFEEAARNHSLINAETGGYLGSRYAYELDSLVPDAEARRLLLSLGRGGLSDLVRIEENWAIFRIEEELKKVDLEDESLLERVRAYLVNNEKGLMYDWATEQANEFIADAKESGFENAANWRNMERHKIGPLPINYGSIALYYMLEYFPISGFTEQDMQNMAANENFWKTAFSTSLQTPSAPFVQGDYVLVLFPIDQTSAEENDLENIKSMYSSYWVQYIAEQSLQTYFLESDKMEDNFINVFFDLLNQ